MKLQSVPRLGISICGCLALILSACGGGNAPNNGTPAAFGAAPASAPADVQPAAVAVTAAPAPDSTSVNGNLPLSAVKAAQRAAAAAAAAVTGSATGDAADGALVAAEAAAVASQVSAKALTAKRDTTSAVTVHLIYVATDGDDSWSGTLAAPNTTRTDGPVKTLPVAQAMARARVAGMNAGAPRVPVRVRIGSGTYYLSAPLVFTPADSGAGGTYVTYEAVTAGTVVISGGVPLTRSATQNAGNAIRFDVPAAAGSGWKGGGQLFVDSQRAMLARQPNAGQYWFVKAPVALSSESANDNGREAFTTNADALAWLNGLSAADRSRAVVNVMQSWTDSHHRLSDQPTPAGSVRVTPRAVSPFLMWGLSQRAYVENVAAALDAPGEWLWDANGVSYIPTSAAAAATSTAVMPVLDKLIVIQGDFNTRNWVQNLWFSGLSFAHTRHLVPDGGAIDSQAAVDVGAAIEADGAVGIVIDHCKVSQTSGYGVWFRRTVRDSRVTNSTLTDLGAGGFKLGQATQMLHDLPTGANSLVGNIVSDTGHVFGGSVGIWLGQGFDNLVSNNAILNTTYTGISVGWTWGYDPSTSGRNRILNNLLSNIGQGHLSDLGGIYTVGISPGTVISGNVIREVRAYPGYGPGGWGIYNDEGASNVLVENNVVVGTDSGGYHLNYGRDNTVRNNLFALGSKFEMRLTRSDPQNTRLAFDGNVMVPLVRQPFDESALAPDVIFSNVRVSDRAAGVALDLSRCGNACSLMAATMTTGADPRHVAIVNIDAATTARFAQIARDSGPAILASAVTVVEVPSVPPVVAVAPPTPLAVDVAGALPGSQPAGIVYQPADPSVIGVVNDAGAPGGRCIAFNDSGAFAYSFYPYVYTSLNHDKGTSTAEFSMKIDANTLMGYEWRDGGNPYKSGPAMLISPAGVVIKGRVVAPAPIGQWLTFRVTAAVDDPTATWALEVTNNSSGVKTSVGNLAFASAGWSKLIWMGFVSDATTTSTACLGGLTVTSSIR